MNMHESIIDYLRSGTEDFNEDGIRVKDLFEALMFAQVLRSVVIEVSDRRSIPYVRRVLFRYWGSPSFEPATNELRYGDIYIIIQSSDEIDKEEENVIEGRKELEIKGSRNVFYVDTYINIAEYEYKHHRLEADKEGRV